MSNRHLARTLAMQTLYQWDFYDRPTDRIKEFEAYNHDEFAQNFDDEGYVEQTVEGVIGRIKEIDEIIVHFAPDWPLEQITAVDRSILRLGIYELKHAPNIPAKVAINEAIELAKAFGGEASGKFVNGVLGAIYRDMTEKGEVKEVDKKIKSEE